MDLVLALRDRHPVLGAVKVLEVVLPAMLMAASATVVMTGTSQEGAATTGAAVITPVVAAAGQVMCQKHRLHTETS